MDYAQLILAYKAFNKNDYVTALDIALPVLSIYKTRNDTTGILKATWVIVYSYVSTKNHKEAIKYLKEQIPICLARRDKGELSGTYNWIGSIYAAASMPDSGLLYAQQSLNIAYELKNDASIIYALTTLAENYIAKGDYDLAMPFLKKSMLFLTSEKNQHSLNYASFLNSFSQAYHGIKQYDSSIYYAHHSLSFFIPTWDIPEQLRAYEYLYKSFDEMGRLDSSNKYFRLAAVVKDSLFSVEKVKAVEVASFSALLRQQALDSEKMKIEDERKKIFNML